MYFSAALIEIQFLTSEPDIKETFEDSLCCVYHLSESGN
jgi:hypothetical protein